MPVADIPPPTSVLTLVFLAWTAGTAGGGAITRLWRGVGAGHFKVIWLVTTGLAAATGFGYRPAWVVAALALLTFAAIYRGSPDVAGRRAFRRIARRPDLPLGLLTAGAAVAAVALHGPLYALAAAALLGGVTNAMLLGHWHLNQPKLGTKPIARLVRGVWGGLVAFVGATALLMAYGRTSSPLASVGAITALAFAGLTVVLTAMVGHLVKTRSIMSATGILYLEVLLCLVAAFTGSLAALAAA